MLHPGSPQPHSLFSFYKAQNLHSDPLLTSPVSHLSLWEPILIFLWHSLNLWLLLSQVLLACWFVCIFFPLSTNAFLYFKTLSSGLHVFMKSSAWSIRSGRASIYVLRNFSLYMFFYIFFLLLFICLTYDIFVAHASSNTWEYFEIISLERGLAKVKWKFSRFQSEGKYRALQKAITERGLSNNRKVCNIWYISHYIIAVKIIRSICIFLMNTNPILKWWLDPIRDLYTT